MANPELGTKQVCPNCQSKFYDLNRRPAVCPKCGTEFDPEEANRSRRVRARSSGPEYEADEEAPAKTPAPEGEEGYEEQEEAPEIDEPAESEPAEAEDGEEGVSPAGAEADIGAEYEEESGDIDSEGEDVPFLEEGGDEDFGDEEIEHHNGGDEDH